MINASFGVDGLGLQVAGCNLRYLRMSPREVPFDMLCDRQARQNGMVRGEFMGTFRLIVAMVV